MATPRFEHSVFANPQKRYSYFCKTKKGPVPAECVRGVTP